jgi:DHA1 family bicyclomycin/chloramphenicol resistance-like MFS transporter
MAQGDRVTPPRHLVPLLAAFTSLVVLTTDVYLPVLPDLGRDLATSNAAAAATISAALVGIAVGQVMFGPLSDAVGRRLPLLLGALGYAVTHLLSALAPNITTLIVARVFVGLATAACVVVSRAVIADAYPGAAATKAYATLGAVIGAAPVLAPVAGGALATVTTWRGMFVLLAVAAVLVAAVGWRALPETLPPQRRASPHLGAVLRDFVGVLRHRHFLAYIAVMAAVGGMLFAYIGASAFVLEDVFGLSAQGFSLVFAANSLGIVATSWLTRRVVARTGPRRLLSIGQGLAIAGAVVLAAGVARSALGVVLAGLFLAVASRGLVMPTSTALAMAQVPERAGSASGIIGISQFSAAAAASPLAGIGGSPWALVTVMLVSAVAGLALRLVLSAQPRPSSQFTPEGT